MFVYDLKREEKYQIRKSVVKLKKTDSERRKKKKGRVREKREKNVDEQRGFQAK